MKRRFISMAICLFMLITSFTVTSCGKEDDLSDVGADAVASAMTLTLWGIRGEGTTDEAIALVEEAMSRITQAQYNTAIKLVLLTEKEYDKALEKKMDEIQEKLDLEAAEAEAKKQAEKEAKKNNQTTTTAEETTAEGETSELADETVLNEYGMVETLYPEVEDNQLDIFLMTDYEMFVKYQEKGVLSALDEQLSAGSKLLKSYIHPNILAAGKVGKTTLAIPTNQKIGEYTYLLLNKELMDKYYHDPDNINSINDALMYLQDVGKDESGIIPFAGDISPVSINYFNPDGDELIVGGMTLPNFPAGTAAPPMSLLSNAVYVKYLKIVKELEANDWIGKTEIKPGDKFGMGIFKGGPNAGEAYEEDYYVKVLQYPTATTDNVYNGMFAVSTYTKSVERSMEIITHLNTRSDLRNLFAYGIEGVHYELDEEGVVKKLSEDYNMSLAYTGNMYVAYPPEGSSPNVWEDAKLNNIDLITAPWFGFSYSESVIDPEVRKGLKSFSEQIYNELDSVPFEELEQWLMDNSSRINENEFVAAFTATEDLNVDDEYVPMGKLYADWMNANYPS